MATSIQTSTSPFGKSIHQLHLDRFQVKAEPLSSFRVRDYYTMSQTLFVSLRYEHIWYITNYFPEQRGLS